MKLVQKRRATGRMLDSYEYVCPGVNIDDRACSRTVSIETFPQVAAALRRSEGKGIING